jgi:tripartite-type tricarboxylate transporter receptor subunit TctC
MRVGHGFRARGNRRFDARYGRLRLLACFAMMTLALACAVARAAPSALAQPYPNRPIRLIVPFAAGGANDIVARLIQPGLAEALGQPIVIENRPAASGVVGTDAVAKAVPDGHTLLMAFTTHTVNPAINPKLPYDTEHDLAPVVMIGKSPLLFIVNDKVPARTFAEFIALAKASPGKLNYATPGAASQAHLLVALWSRLAGVELQHVPYKGGAPAVLGTVTGETQMTVMSPIASLVQIKAGTLRPLAVTSLERDSHFPDLPSIAEAGFPGFEGVAWVGLFTTAGTPREIIERLNLEVNRILRDPQFGRRLDEQGMTPAGGSPEDFAAFVSREIRRWRDAAQAANVKME